MNKIFFLTMAIFAYMMTACGPSAQAQTATADMATSRAVDATFEAIRSGTQTAQAASTPCAPPIAMKDPLLPDTQLRLTKWIAWTNGELTYQTPYGVFRYVQIGTDIRMTRPDGSTEIFSIGEGELRAHTPTVVLEQGVVERRGPVLFYRCGGTLWLNEEYEGRVVRFTPDTPLPQPPDA